MAPVCRYFAAGNCRNGDRCRFEHVDNRNVSNNRFAPLGAASNSPDVKNNTRLQFAVTRDSIQADLTKERPQWILSSYGPGRDAPIQLFGGFPREQSFEEVRLAHYLGSGQDAISAERQLVDEAERQMKSALNDLDGAVKYVLDGQHKHPNRFDICNSKGSILPAAATTSAKQPAPSSFGTSSQLGSKSSPFGQPSTGQTTGNSFGGQPSSAGLGSVRQPPAFGRSTFGQPNQPAFGQPSATSAFGQANWSTFGQATQPTFEQPSQTTFGQSSKPAFGQPNPSTFGQPSQSGFGQPSNPSTFGQASSTPSFGQSSQQSVFGQASQPSASPAAFGGPSQQQQQQSAFGQHSNSFNQVAPSIPAFGQPRTSNQSQAQPIQDIYLLPPGVAEDPGLVEEWEYLKATSTFKDGIMPRMPPPKQYL